MRPIIVPAIVALGLLALPAFAQSSSTNSSNGASKASPQDVSQLEQTLHQDLSKAGYTDIQIVPGSFLVRAKDSKGQMTEMMISPNSVTEVTAMPSASGSSQSASSGSSSTTKK